MDNEIKIVDDYDVLKDFLQWKTTAFEFVDSLRNQRQTEDADYEIVKPKEITGC